MGIFALELALLFLASVGFGFYIARNRWHPIDDEVPAEKHAMPAKTLPGE